MNAQCWAQLHLMHIENALTLVITAPLMRLTPNRQSLENNISGATGGWR